MKQRGLRPSARILESAWLKPRMRRFGSGVAGVVPDGFPAYVRILHPARGANQVPVSWAEIAAWSGRRMHRLVQFHRIAQPLSSSGVESKPWDGEDPESGNPPAELLSALCAALSGHTSTANSCWFCLWDGHGWLYGSPAVSAVSSTEQYPASVGEEFAPIPPALPLELLQELRVCLPQRSDILPSVGQECAPIPPALPLVVLQGPRVCLPQRNYILFEGPLSAATQLGWALDDVFFSQSPNLFWPQDHAWCVASEIDLFCTLVAGSESLAEALVAHPSLEAWRVNPGDPITYDSDRINT